MKGDRVIGIDLGTTNSVLLSLGIETEGGLFTKLVERNTTVPIEKKQVFSTAEDNQTAVTVQVYQGERPMASDNRLLGEFKLRGIPAARRGLPQIEVKFDVDANGILNVSAKDLGTGKEASVRIAQSSGLDDAEIDRMKRDAEQHAEGDRRRRELVEARNRADNVCYQLEKMMQEHKDMLHDADHRPLAQAIVNVRDAAKGDGVSAISSAVDQLENAAHVFSKWIYGRAKPNEQMREELPPGTWCEENEATHDAIDAEFEVKA